MSGKKKISKTGQSLPLLKEWTRADESDELNETCRVDMIENHLYKSSHGIWISSGEFAAGAVKLTQIRGNWERTMGFASDSSEWLHPEEALFLVKQGQLVVFGTSASNASRADKACKCSCHKYHCRSSAASAAACAPPSSASISCLSSSSSASSSRMVQCPDEMCLRCSLILNYNALFHQAVVVHQCVSVAHVLAYEKLKNLDYIVRRRPRAAAPTGNCSSAGPLLVPPCGEPDVQPCFTVYRNDGQTAWTRSTASGSSAPTPMALTVVTADSRPPPPQVLFPLLTSCQQEDASLFFVIVSRNQLHECSMNVGDKPHFEDADGQVTESVSPAAQTLVQHLLACHYTTLQEWGFAAGTLDISAERSTSTVPVACVQDALGVEEASRKRARVERDSEA